MPHTTRVNSLLLGTFLPGTKPLLRGRKRDESKGQPLDLWLETVEEDGAVKCS